MFAQGNQATSNEPIIKWNCLRSYGSRGGRVGQSGWARHPPVFVATIMLIYLPVLSLFLSFSLVSINHGSRLHSRRQFAGHTKRVDNLKGKSSLLTEEGHGTANARAFSCSVEHNASRWTRRAPSVPFSFGRRSTHYHMDPRPPDPRPSALHLTPSRVVAVSPLLVSSACLSLS